MVESVRRLVPTSEPPIPRKPAKTPTGGDYSVRLAAVPAVLEQGRRTTARTVNAYPLPWSHSVRLMAVRDDFPRWFYEDEAVRGGWSVRQLDRQISTLL